ncbi:MAG: ATP-binding protein [Victivallaceae bacterium]|nr:ATP-binding protein [Victivallaceae bacterium]
MNNEQIMQDSIFKIGEVISVDGRKIKIRVDKAKNTSYTLFKGQLLKNISVGSYVKILKGFSKIICKVDGEFIDEDKHFTDKDYKNAKDKISRTLAVSILGFFEGENFERGIKELPLVFDECFLLGNQEFEKVHDFVKKDDEPLLIGTLSLEKGQNVNIGVNSLFASHIGIFGNTGSGKSYTLAKLYETLFKKFEDNPEFKKNASFLLFDFNGEYAHDKTITESKKIYNLTTRKELHNIKDDEKLPLKETDLLDIELISILSNATDKTQKPFLKRTIDFLKHVNANNTPLEYFRNILKKRIKLVLKMTDKGRAYILVEYLTLIINKENGDSLIESLDWQNTLAYFMPKGVSRQVNDTEIEATDLYKNVDSYEFPNNLISKLIDFLYLQIVLDIYNDKAQNEHIAPAISKLKSKQKDIEKVFNTKVDNSDIYPSNINFVVINLNEVNLEIKKILPLLILKTLYTEQKNKYVQDHHYLNIIIDEAHNILSHVSNRESETWKDYRLETFEEVIKEGRKFGVFLTIASQRPSDISSTIISQLHNYFLHRLINNNDILAVEKTISYLDKVSFEYLPILPTGTCIFAGLSAQIPVIIDIAKIKKGYEPKNETIKLTDHWGKTNEIKNG